MAAQHTRQPDDGSDPGAAIVRIASGIAPKDVTGRFGRCAREGSVDPDEAVLDEGAHVMVGQGWLVHWADMARLMTLLQWADPV